MKTSLLSRLDRIAIVLGLAALAGIPLQAQRMTVADAAAAPVVVESAAIDTEVTGRIAVTTFDLTFRNPNGRILEGTFEFPLLDGQQVVGFGLDIGGVMRDAVPVEKERGRAVFEEIERRRVDPGLLERTAGNNYRARVYPIPANGTRRVKITYQENLGRQGDASAYRLALDFPDRLARFALNVQVHRQGGALPKVRSTLPLELPGWQAGDQLRLVREGFSAQGLFELEVPRPARAEILTELREGREYFYAELDPGPRTRAARPLPKVVGLLWDASASGAERDHAREFALLDAWFAAVGNVEVRLVTLRDQAAAPVKFTVRGGDWRRLRTELERMVYDGATSFDQLADDPAVGEWLLFSDGLVNYGVTQAEAKLPLKAPVHAILAGSRADPARLRGLARQQSGEYVNLLAMSPTAAAEVLRHVSWRVLAVETVPTEVAQVFPETGTPVGESMIVAGLLKSPVATVTLRIGPDERSAIPVELTVRSGQNSSRLAARGWAATKIASLEENLAANREDVRRTSREFGIVTADTSLIVLETLEDYVRYDITPPAELRDLWAAHRRQQADNRRKETNTRLDEFAHLWAERVEWWETVFPKTPPPAPKARSRPAPESPVRPVGSPERAAAVGGGATTGTGDDEVLELSPFEVSAPEDRGYAAMSTLAGSRVRIELRDVGSSVSVVTSEFLADTGATSADALQYTASTEVGGTRGNFAGPPEPTPAAITLLRPWTADSGATERLRRAPDGRRYAIYLEERSEHAREPGFFLQAAACFLDAGQADLGLRILSNLAELQLEDEALLRVLAHRLMEAGHPGLALPLFERVLALRPDEPQSRRDLALACAAVKQFQRAVDLLWAIVEEPVELTGSGDRRYPEIELIVLGEMNAIIATCGETLDLSRIDARFHRNLPVGLRIVLTWDANDCDIDLWVGDPNRELAIYNHPRTYQGGRMSRDYMNGYGPEEFMLRDPRPGRYSVRLNYYGDHRSTQLGPVTAQIRLITGFGTAAQQEKRLTVRLDHEADNEDVGFIDIGGR